ncbi:MAG: hypothetical protein JWR36_2018 [Glaciihabitans sp.]|nr:hypothetical protein [Glaciihabitans sp.]
MTNPTPQAQPGWYPVAPGSSQLRWWDGTQWTEHFHDASAAAAIAPTATLKAPEGTDPNTVWAWLASLTPILGVVGVVWYYSTLGAVFSSIATDPSVAHSNLLMMQMIYSPAYFGLLGLGLLGYAASVVFGWLDWRTLKARGVPSPFHWAWSFLEAPLVYIIGRSVVVRRRTGRGLGPLWLLIAVVVVGLTIVFVEISVVLGGVFATLPSPGTY